MEKEYQPNTPCPKPNCTGTLRPEASEVIPGARINPLRDLACDKCGYVIKRAKA